MKVGDRVRIKTPFLPFSSAGGHEGTIVWQNECGTVFKVKTDKPFRTLLFEGVDFCFAAPEDLELLEVKP